MVNAATTTVDFWASTQEIHETLLRNSSNESFM